MKEVQDAVVLLGKTPWQIKFVTRKDMPKKLWGDCNWNTKTIRVRKDLSVKNMTDTLIHEMRHAQSEVMYEAESYVNWTSTELAQGLESTGVI